VVELRDDGRADAPDLREVVGLPGRRLRRGLRGGLRRRLGGLGGAGAAGAAARTAGLPLRAAGPLGLDVVEVDELDDGQLGGVARALAERDDPGGAAGAVPGGAGPLAQERPR